MAFLLSAPRGRHSTYQYSPENLASLTMSVERVSKSSFQVEEKQGEKREKRETHHVSQILWRLSLIQIKNRVFSAPEIAAAFLAQSPSSS
jgi:hypothetical protein